MKPLREILKTSAQEIRSTPTTGTGPYIFAITLREVIRENQTTQVDRKTILRVKTWMKTNNKECVTDTRS